MQGLRIVLLAALSVLLLSAPATAALQSGDSVHGIDSITLDTLTGLSWLDVTLTKGRSYNDVASKFGAGDEFEGFRHASATDITQLFQNAGIPNVLGGPTVANWAPATALQQLVGLCYSGGLNPADWTIGVAGIVGSVGNHKLSSMRVFHNGTAQMYVSNGGNQADGAANADRGHWLVSEQTVPVDTSSFGKVKSLFR